MISYVAEIRRSWVRSAPSVRDLSALLGLSMPLGLRDIVDRLRAVETISIQRDVHTDDAAAINGRVAFELRSDGTYVFSGHMRATGASSYDYGIQAWVATSGGTAIVAQRRGSVYGTDTPGERQDNWNQAGDNPGIIDEWRSLRANHSIGYHLQAEIGGVLGGALGVLKFAVKGIVANAVLGPAGWGLLIGNELAGMDAKIQSPNVLAGILVAGGVFLVVGPFGLVPAIVAGAAAADLTNVRHRPMRQAERDFADMVFGGSIDYDRIILTNLTNPEGRRFTWPYLGNSIIVNLDNDGFDSPTTVANSRYPLPGQVFIHELAHAWQISHQSLVRVVHKLDDDYGYYPGWIPGMPNSSARAIDTSWRTSAWEAFKTEEQATIVDEWYAVHRGSGSSPRGIKESLDSSAALRDPAFRFILNPIRAAVP